MKRNPRENREPEEGRAKGGKTEENKGNTQGEEQPIFLTNHRQRTTPETMEESGISEKEKTTRKTATSAIRDTEDSMMIDENPKNKKEKEKWEKAGKRQK